jgi:hypothetical protein
MRESCEVQLVLRLLTPVTVNATATEVDTRLAKGKPGLRSGQRKLAHAHL